MKTKRSSVYVLFLVLTRCTYVSTNFGGLRPTYRLRVVCWHVVVTNALIVVVIVVIVNDVAMMDVIPPLPYRRTYAATKIVARADSDARIINTIVNVGGGG
jgi:hypothetical protein